MNRTISASLVILTLAFALCVLQSGASLAQTITYTESPRDLELFARDRLDSAEVAFAGNVTVTGHDSVRLEILREGAPWRTSRAHLTYQNGAARFRVAARIHAERAEYLARLFLDGVLVARRDSLLAGDIFLINGQSNAVAAGEYPQDRSEWLRSFGTSYPASYCAQDTLWGKALASSQYTHLAVGSWGLFLGLSLIDTYGIPVAILNGAVGGTPISEHQRNETDPTDLDTIYGRLLWRCRQAGIDRHVRAIFWHQGENDTWDTWSVYKDQFGALWNDWQADYAPLEKVYVFQIHPGCGGPYQTELRDVQRTLPGDFPRLTVMSTAGISGHDGCHYSNDGYRQMARWIFGPVARDFYGSSDTWYILPPDVEAAWYTDTGHREIRVRFDSEVVWPADTLGIPMRDYFLLDGESHRVSSGWVDSDGRTVVLSLTHASNDGTLTYIPSFQYGPPGAIYEGPWIRNPRGIGALTFQIPIQLPAEVEEGGGNPGFLLIGASPNPAARGVRIAFRLAAPGALRFQVFDTGGRTVWDEWAGRFEAGPAEIVWSGTDGAGHSVSAGTYLYRLSGARGALSGKLTLLSR